MTPSPGGRGQANNLFSIQKKLVRWPETEFLKSDGQDQTMTIAKLFTFACTVISVSASCFVVFALYLYIFSGISGLFFQN